MEMQPREAIDIIKRMNKGEVTETQKNALEMAYKALEKQISRTPMLEGYGCDNDGNVIYDTWICPNCEEDYEIDYDNYAFCPECGQAIEKSAIGIV